MRDRTIDLALVVGLVVVAGAIVWTLFSLGGDRRAPPPSDAGSVASPSGSGGVVPIAPDGSPAEGDDATDAPDADDAGGTANADASVQPLPPDAGGGDGATPGNGDAGAAASSADAAGADAGPAPASDGGPAPDRPDPEIPAAAAPPVPTSGPAGVGRVGFSFVTGGAGACGIVLEPWSHVAVSRELLDAYGCGAQVTLTLDDPKDGRTTVQAVVADTMNPSFSRTVNVYVGEDEPALQYGLTSGTIERR